jgi:biotin-dependent carboxylase-like uncharacterized protein
MISVIEAGFFSTIQDLGRTGSQDLGVPVSGVMDSHSAILANTLLGNDENDAVIEMTLTGSKLLFDVNTAICISGAHFSPSLNDTPFKLNKVISVQKGDILSFGRLKYGVRTYLAVKGGIISEKVLNSRSMYRNITTYFKIEKNDEMEIREYDDISDAKHASVKIVNDHFQSDELSVHAGPEFDQLTPNQQKGLFTREFNIAKENNRMAYQLEQLLENELSPIITSLVLPGTVQLTPSGKLLILMRDCQTSGGYPRVLQLEEQAINTLSQKFTGDRVRFKPADSM